MQNEHVTVSIPMCVAVNSKTVKIKDIVQIAGSNAELIGKINDKIFHVFDKDERAIFSATSLVSFIENEFKGLTVNLSGETEVIVKYKKALTAKDKFWQALKVIFVSLAVCFGSAFTIMTFNSDVDVGGVFKTIYKLAAYPNPKDKVLEISYSIGIFFGILLFFNHFSRKKEKSDPTPIQVQMFSYEQGVNQTVIEEAVRNGEVK